MIGKGKEKRKSDLRQASHCLIHRERALEHKLQGHPPLRQRIHLTSHHQLWVSVWVEGQGTQRWDALLS